MDVTIDFTPQEEEWLNSQTQRLGLSYAEVIKKLVDQNIAPPDNAGISAETAARLVGPKNEAAIAMLDSWILEGVSADPETKRKADQEVEEFKKNMNANRASTGETAVFP